MRERVLDWARAFWHRATRPTTVLFWVFAVIVYPAWLQRPVLRLVKRAVEEQVPESIAAAGRFLLRNSWLIPWAVVALVVLILVIHAYVETRSSVPSTRHEPRRVDKWYRKQGQVTRHEWEERGAEQIVEVEPAIEVDQAREISAIREHAQVLKEPESHEMPLPQVVWHTTGGRHLIGTEAEPETLEFREPVKQVVRRSDLPITIQSSKGSVEILTFAPSGFWVEELGAGERYVALVWTLKKDNP